MRLSVFKMTLFAIASALAVNISTPLHAQDATKKHEPHPTFAAFLEELEAGELEKAAGRIASVNDLFGRSRQYVHFSQQGLVTLLATCDLTSHTSLRISEAVEKTIWDCPGGQQYSMIFNSAGDAPNPYLYVHRIETEETRKAKEARFAKRMASGQFPQPRLVMHTPMTAKERAEREERWRFEELQAAKRRDILGDAIVSGNLDAFSDFVTDDTYAAYITHDRYFDVKIKHINGISLEELLEVIEIAKEELGAPVSVKCWLGEGKWAPHICQWELENPENSLRAEMNFKGEGGTMNSIRFYRQTPEELAQLRQQAIDLGVFGG